MTNLSTECIRAFRLHDWTQKTVNKLIDSFKNEDGPIIEEINICDDARSSDFYLLTAELVDENGRPISPEKGITVTDLTNYETKHKETTGKLKKVRLEFSGFYVIKIFNTKTRVTCVTTPVSFSFIDQTYLCVPTYVKVDATVINAELNVSTLCVCGELTSLDVFITACFQVFSGLDSVVRIQVLDQCQPRPDISSVKPCTSTPSPCANCIFP
ncbi:BMQ_0737 family morphogenetic spore coat protein [Priestia megaterium]|uniref:hypothetical protein n=1 Tax=Priestia megaterium TaxID=1404 RepID=UPI00390C4792